MMYRYLKYGATALALGWSFAGIAPAWADDVQGAAGVAGSGGASGKLMNPDISLDGLFALSQFNRKDPLVFDGGHDPHGNGFNIQQVELSLGAAIDPYFRGDANLVLTTEGIEIEEAYATTLGLPANLQLKAGQFFTAFGRMNPTHPHTWDFADKPLVLGRFFGGDGLRSAGAQLSWLTPLPWYSELIASAQNSAGATVPSFLPKPDTGPTPSIRSVADLLYLARWNNFLSLSDDWSFNFGGSFVTGPNNQEDGFFTRVAGVDLFLKYRRPESLSFIYLQVEALERFYQTASGTQNDWGWYAQTDYRLDAPWERWHIGLRYDYVGPRNAPVSTVLGTDPTNAFLDQGSRWRISPVVTFYPSEFSKVRFQYNYDRPEFLDSAQHVAIVQLEFLMGAHGAHKF